VRWCAPLWIALGLAGCLPEPDVELEPGVDLLTGEVETVSGWYRFTEGPAADLSGGVYFSDYVQQRIYHRAADGEVTVLREGTPSNGLSVGPDGTLFACEPTERRVVRLDAEGQAHEVTGRYAGKRYNSCNDLWVDPAGGVYFTDPMYSKDRAREVDGEHVYYVPPGGEPVRVIDDLVRPNGVVGTADGELLFVVDDGAHATYRYEIEAPGQLGARTKLADRGHDGITVDEAGRIYVVDEDEVLVLSPTGARLGALEMPFRPTNVTFAGEGRGDLIVTGKWVVHVISTKTRAGDR